MKAPGTLIEAGGSRFHVRRPGNPRGPVVVFETGLTMMSACWGWLVPELESTCSLFLYDRAGLGWSDFREGLRDSAQAATELNGLLDAACVEGKIILAGHSLGALINRAFYRQNPSRVAAMVWLDAAHPDQINRRGARRRMRNFFIVLEAASLLAARDLPRLEFPLIQQVKGLPPEDFLVSRHFFRHPAHLRTTAREARAWELSSSYVRETALGDLPLLVISAQRHGLPGWMEMQKELCELSTQCENVTFTDVSHLSLLAEREHAARAAAEIRKFVAGLKL